MLLPLFVAASLMQDLKTSIVERPTPGANRYYTSSRAPLQPTPFIKLPVTAFQPGGWLKRSLELQRDGLAGHLGEVSVWLTKEDNAWLNPSGKGKYGWEEVPYWLRGYSRIAYLLQDPRMLAETKVWIEGTLASARPDGDFGPIHNHEKGFRDLWAQMLMLQVLQSWFEYAGDARVLPFMTNYFKWEMKIPDEHFLKDYWENSRGGDNLASVYWLYDRTGDSFLLDLAQKIDRNTANWRQTGDLPNYHNVNIAECFREPATFWLQSGNPKDLQASYNNQEFIREKYGQVPGGMFGSDENARPGHDDPHQAVETCAMVEQIMSNGFMTSITADDAWLANTEDVAFNTLPAAFTADYRSLRYFTAPNMVASDAENHAPGIANGGPFFLMNPFSSRCCQHNHSSAWPNYVEGSWMATPDNGLAALLYHEGTVTARVGAGEEVTIKSSTHYPFDGKVMLTVGSSKDSRFPLYLRIPSWANGARAVVDGRQIKAEPGKYLCLSGTWKDGDTVELELPMTPRVKVWDQMKHSASVEYGPLTFSLKIGEEFRKVDTKKTAIGDSGWQPTANPEEWPTYEILPTTPWNYGLVAKPSFKVIHKEWPADDFPFTAASVPLEIETEGKKIPTWTLDENGLVSILPKSPVTTPAPEEKITLIPMGAARLRISAFPVVR
jgi:hypothetical protein